MNPEIKAEWINQLRSGKWTQICHDLIDFNPHTGEIDPTCRCALGVLGHVLGVSPETLAQKGSGIDAFFECGMDLEAQNTIAEMNDPVDVAINNEPSHTFGEIADYIESHL